MQPAGTVAAALDALWAATGESEKVLYGQVQAILTEATGGNLHVSPTAVPGDRWQQVRNLLSDQQWEAMTAAAPIVLGEEPAQQSMTTGQVLVHAFEGKVPKEVLDAVPQGMLDQPAGLGELAPERDWWQQVMRDMSERHLGRLAQCSTWLAALVDKERHRPNRHVEPSQSGWGGVVDVHESSQFADALDRVLTPGSGATELGIHCVLTVQQQEDLNAAWVASPGLGVVLYAGTLTTVTAGIVYIKAGGTVTTAAGGIVVVHAGATVTTAAGGQVVVEAGGVVTTVTAGGWVDVQAGGVVTTATGGTVRLKGGTVTVRGATVQAHSGQVEVHAGIVQLMRGAQLDEEHVDEDTVKLSTPDGSLVITCVSGGDYQILLPDGSFFRRVRRVLLRRPDPAEAGEPSESGQGEPEDT